MPECFPNLLFGLSMDQTRVGVPKGFAFPLPGDVPCFLLEMHYKAPPLIPPRLDEKQRLRSAVSLSDSSGVRLTFEQPTEGTAFKGIQIIDVGPREVAMLDVPPRQPNLRRVVATLTLERNLAASLDDELVHPA